MSATLNHPHGFATYIFFGADGRNSSVALLAPAAVVQVAAVRRFVGHVVSATATVVVFLFEGRCWVSSPQVIVVERMERYLCCAMLSTVEKS